MRRLLWLAVAIAILIGAVSSHSNSKTTTTAVTAAPVVPAHVASKPKRRSVSHVRYTNCDQNISVGPATTCEFADNVFRAFAHEVNSGGGADHTVTTSSPVTGKTYTMACRTSGVTTLCTGGHSARVRFPLTAAETYYPSSTSTPRGGTGAGEEQEAPEAEEATPQGEEPEGECTNGTYTNSAGSTVCSPEESPSGPPSGATAECADGTYSFSESRSGTCSHHGGVATWLR